MNKKIRINLIACVFALTVMLFLFQETNAQPLQSNKIYNSIENKIDTVGSADVIIRITKIIKSEDKDNSGYNSKQIKSFEMLSKNIKAFENKKRHTLINMYSKKNIYSETYSGILTKKELKELKNLEKQGYTLELYEDTIFYLEKTRQNKEEIKTALDISTVSIGANYSNNILNITGRNITVAVIDSGIDYNHTDLGGCFGEGCRVSNGYDFVNSDNDPMDDNTDSHGTHVAGIIGARGNITGVAPEVNFYAVKACDNTGACQLSDIIDSIDWAINNSADIISLSLGGSYSDVAEGNTGKDIMSEEIETAVQAGIIVVIASGNDGPGISTVAVPGAAVDAITVGNINDQGTISQSDDIIVSSSGRGPSAFGRLDPDVVAPGQSIYSTKRDNTYGILSGTSMATPHVSGLAALLLEQSRNNAITLTPGDVKRIIINSAVNVSGKLFEVGAGEINAINALTNNRSAIIIAENSYGIETSSDRWEFVSPITDTAYANISVVNDNDYEINFSLSIGQFQNLENSIILNNTQFEIPANIIVQANSEYNFSINFSLTNFSQEYSTTYGGKIMLSGNDSKNITIPIVVTIPIKNYARINRILNNSGASDGDVLYYAYYNVKSGNENITINWNSTSNDLDLYLYNSTADLENYVGEINTESESIITTSSDLIKWIRIHGYSFISSPFNFSINITDNGNIAPNITNITTIEGDTEFDFSISENITIVFYFTNPDNDSQTITLNDTRYELIELNDNINNTINNVSYIMMANESLIGTHIVRLTIEDDYGAQTYADTTITVYDIQITSYAPNNLTPNVRKNDTINFSQMSTDTENSQLYYYWYIDGILNNTEQNFSLDTTELNNDYYNITFIASNNQTNISMSWNLSIDKYGPLVNIISPDGTLNNSIVLINFTVSDPAGVDTCWYNINDSEDSELNTTIVNCANTSTFLNNGEYELKIYSNDTYGFISETNKTFTINDTTAPIILSVGPSGTVDEAPSIILTATTNEPANCSFNDEDVSYESMTHNFLNYETTHNKSYSVDPDTSYLIYVRCVDYSNNTNSESALLNFTVNEDTSANDNSNSAGGGASYAPVSVEQTTSYINKYNAFIVETDDNITVNINSENIAIKYIFIKVIGTQRNIDMSIIQHTSETMPDVADLFSTDNADKIEYALIEIKHDNLDNSAIDNTKILFDVKTSWITDNNMDISSIKLYRYTDSWNEVSTSIHSQDSVSVTFESESLGLSYFIIAGQKNIQIENPSTDATADNELTGENILIQKQSGEEQPFDIKNTEQKTASDTKTHSVLILIVIAIISAILVADIIYTRKKHVAKIVKKENIENIKKQYLFEGNQLINEYNNHIKSLLNDSLKKQKTELLKQQYNRKITEIQNKYKELIQQSNNKK